MKKEINFFSAVSMVMGIVIGAGVFFKTGTVASYTHSVSWTLFAWIFGGFLTLCAGLTVAELATAIPETGGAVKYLEKSYGKLTGFLLGWGQSLIYYPANIAALCMIFSTQLLNLFHISDKWLIPASLITAISVSAITLLGTKVAAKVQSVTLVVKLIPIAVIVLAGLFQKEQVSFQVLPTSSLNEEFNFSGALLATLFAYDGWLSVGNIAGEMKNPKKDLPRAIIYGLSFVTIVYVLINWTILKTLPMDQIAGNNQASSLAAERLLGSQGGKIVTIGLLISVYGTLNGYTLSGTRVPFALALENEWPFSKLFKKLSPHTKVPYMVTLMQLFLALFMLSLGNFDYLTDMAIFVMWLFNLLLLLAVFRLRKTQPDLLRPYKVPLFPILPIFAILGASFILIMTLLNQTVLSLTGIFLTLLGIPVYFFVQKRKGSLS